MPWSFGGDDLDVAADGPIFPEWFKKRVEVTIDPVLGADARYVDIGAVVYDPVELVAQFATTGARNAIRDRVGTVATLEDDDGRSCQALLKSAEEIRVAKPGSGVYRLAVEFEFVSSS